MDQSHASNAVLALLEQLARDDIVDPAGLQAEETAYHLHIVLNPVMDLLQHGFLLAEGQPGLFLGAEQPGLGRLEVALFLMKVIEDVENRLLYLLKALPLRRKVVQNVQDSRLCPLKMVLLHPGIFEDIHHGALHQPQAPFFGVEIVQYIEEGRLARREERRVLAEILEDIHQSLSVAGGSRRPYRLNGLERRGERKSRRGHYCACISRGTSLRRSSISFLSSIILSSRPMVSFWNRSSSASLSSSLARCSATSASAFFCAFTSRAAAKTPKTFPFTSL